MGNANLNEDDFIKYQEDNNISVGAGLGSSTLSIKGYSSTNNIDKTISSISDIINHPRIKQEEFDEAISRLQDGMKRSKDSSNSLYIDHQAKINPLYTSKAEVEEGLKSVTLEEVQELHNYIRGLSENPGAYFFLDDKKFKVYKSRIFSDEILGEIGQFVEASKRGLLFQTKNGLLALDDIQLEGKKRMDYKSFINGYKDIINKHLN